jgi:hypothetical protein
VNGSQYANGGASGDHQCRASATAITNSTAIMINQRSFRLPTGNDPSSRVAGFQQRLCRWFGVVGCLNAHRNLMSCPSLMSPGRQGSKGTSAVSLSSPQCAQPDPRTRGIIARDMLQLRPPCSLQRRPQFLRRCSRCTGSDKAVNHDCSPPPAHEIRFHRAS